MSGSYKKKREAQVSMDNARHELQKVNVLLAELQKSVCVPVVVMEHEWRAIDEEKKALVDSLLTVIQHIREV